MSVQVKTFYDEQPYASLGDPELGALPIEASRKEVDTRYTALTRKGRPSHTVSTAWGELKSPGKRATWDIFYAPLTEKQPAVGDLVKQKPIFQRTVDTVLGFTFGREFLILEQLDDSEKPPSFTLQETPLSLSARYDDLEKPLREVVFEA